MSEAVCVTRDHVSAWCVCVLVTLYLYRYERVDTLWTGGPIIMTLLHGEKSGCITANYDY